MADEAERLFPVLHGHKYKDCPRAIPWRLLVPHAAQAAANHSQSLETLASRGGLAPCEIVAVFENRRHRRMVPAEAVARLREIVGSGVTRTCEHCTHFEPDTHRCARDPVRIVRDVVGKRIELLPIVRPEWACDSFDLYVEGPVPERKYEA